MKTKTHVISYKTNAGNSVVGYAYDKVKGTFEIALLNGVNPKLELVMYEVASLFLDVINKKVRPNIVLDFDDEIEISIVTRLMPNNVTIKRVVVQTRLPVGSIFMKRMERTLIHLHEDNRIDFDKQPFIQMDLNTAALALYHLYYIEVEPLDENKSGFVICEDTPFTAQTQRKELNPTSYIQPDKLYKVLDSEYEGLVYEGPDIEDIPS